MTIFPYVYPNLRNEIFLKQADWVVGLFLIFFLSALAIPTYLAVKGLNKKIKKHPVFNNKIPEEEFEEEDLRAKWMGIKKKPKEPEEEESVIGEEPNTEKVDTKKAVSETSYEEEESEESSEEDTEFVTETEESSDENTQGNADDYANQRRIPAADVNLDTQAGFSTGLSGLREAEIQKFRQEEKRLA